MVRSLNSAEQQPMAQLCRLTSLGGPMFASSGSPVLQSTAAIYGDLDSTPTADRSWERRFRLHAFSLLAVLLAFFPLVVGDTIWSADIGARLYQVKVLLNTGAWSSPHPFPAVDPEGLHYPFHLSTSTVEPYHYLVFGKHPVLVWLTAGLHQLGGLRAIVVVNTVGTWAAAVGAAQVVARTRPALTIAALWFTGMLTPLFFDGYIGYIHTAVAALLVWAGLLVLRFADPAPRSSRQKRSGAGSLVGAAALVALACLLRTEAAFAGIALAGGGLAAGHGRSFRTRWHVSTAVLVLATVGAVLLDRFTAPAATGHANAGHAASPWGGLAGRLQGFQRTWLLPGSFDVDLLIVLVAVILFVVGFSGLGRRRAGGVEVLLIIGLIAAVVRVAVPQPILIFGLMMACPLLILGLIKALPRVGRNPESILCTVTFVLFSGAVILTQYRHGGTAEWGGRYFAAGVPFAAAVAVPGLASLLSEFTLQRAQRIVGLAATTALIINLGGLHSLAVSRSTTRAMTEDVARAMTTVSRQGWDSGRAGGIQPAATKAVVVTTLNPLARLTWEVVDDGAWVLVDHDELAALGERLADLGIGRFVLVSVDPEADLAAVDGLYRVEDENNVKGTAVRVIIVSEVVAP